MLNRVPRAARPVFAAAIVIAFAIAVTACGGGSSSSSSSSGSETSSETASSGGDSSALVAEARELTEKAEEQPAETPSIVLGPFKPKPDQTIYSVECDRSVEGCNNMAEGVEEAVKAIGYNFEDCATSNTDPTSATKCMTNALNASPNAIVVNGLTWEQVGQQYTEAENAGIPTVNLNSGDTKPNEGAKIEVGADFCYQEGVATGKWAIAETEGNAHVVVAYSSAINCFTQRWLGVQKGLEGCESCTVEAAQFDYSAIQTQLPQLVLSKLQADPEVNIVVACTGDVADLAAQPVEQASTGGREIKLSSFDGTTPNIKSIQSGNGPLVMDITNGTREPGWIMVDAAARSIAGEKVPHFLPLDSVMITPKNIDQFPNGFVGATDFESQFETMWGK